MKYSFSISSFIVLFFSISFLSCWEINAQDSGPGEEVKKTWKKMYPKENDPDWEKDKNGNYEASFKKKGVHYRADFSPDGRWIETENSLKKKKLPKAIKKLLKKEYDDFKIVEIEFVSHYEKGEFYDLELKEKGKDKFDLMVREDGEVIGRGEKLFQK